MCTRLRLGVARAQQRGWSQVEARFWSTLYLMDRWVVNVRSVLRTSYFEGSTEYERYAVLRRRRWFQAKARAKANGTRVCEARQSTGTPYSVVGAVLRTKYVLCRAGVRGSSWRPIALRERDRVGRGRGCWSDSFPCSSGGTSQGEGPQATRDDEGTQAWAGETQVTGSSASQWSWGWRFAKPTKTDH